MLGRLSCVTTAAVLACGVAYAEGNLSRQPEIELNLELAGSCEPTELTFETGKLYKLNIRNSTDRTMDFVVPGLAPRIFTRKVQMWDGADGVRIAEVKGYITELEVFPGKMVEWWFVPIATTRSALAVACAGGEAAFNIM